MKKKQNNFARAFALQITLAVSAILLAPTATPTATPSNTFMVTNTNDSGAGSLRQAILDANNNPGLDTIAFNIPGSGVHTITPATDLATITEAVVIDGYTQSGASPNTLTIGDNAVLLIELAGPNSNGIGLNLGGSGGSTVRGLVINRFSTGVLANSSNNNTIAGNFLGTDPTGMISVGTGSIAVSFQVNSGNTIGGTTPVARNVISATGGVITLQTSTGNTMQGNYIGINAAGTGALPAFDGIFLNLNSTGNTIGGTASGAGNVFGNFSNSGVRVDAGSSSTTVQGNLIGTNATGTAGLTGGGSAGVIVSSFDAFQLFTANVTVGGTAAGAGNLISGVPGGGISTGGSVTGILIQGNRIGTDITGTTAIPNGGCGINVNLLSQFGSVPAASTIGGTVAGAGNLIAFNGGTGVCIVSGNTGWAILGNSITSNTGLGIDLNVDGVTANDHCDIDTGANNLQNYPVITSASFGGGFVTLSGTLDSVPNTGFRVEFFSNTEGDPSGFGEGRTFLGSTIVNTGGSCSASFGPLSFPVPSGQLLVTATATILDAGGNPIETSEFSAFFPGPPPPMPTAVVSRKTHGSAGTFDIDLPLTGNVGIECRSGGAANNYQMIISFANSVTVENASVASGTGSVSSFSVSGSQVTVNLTGVTNVQRITVTLHNVNDGMHSGDVPLSMGVLVGDVNGNAVVNSSDVSLTKSQVGQAVTGSNFREDVNVNGTISSTDVALVKAKVGTALPP
jgi:hypothetical protein